MTRAVYAALGVALIWAIACACGELCFRWRRQGRRLEFSIGRYLVTIARVSDVEAHADPIERCSRPQPHDGPCNGWPCPPRIEELSRKMLER